MRQREASFKRQILTKLRRIPLSWWERIEQQAISGTPDIIGVVYGSFVAIEAKTDEGQPTALQLLKLRSIRKAGGFVSIMTPSNVENEFRRLQRHIERTLKKSSPTP